MTPDDLMNGTRPSGDVVIYDDEHYYMASVLAELLLSEGLKVTFVTSASVIGPFMNYTVEQERTQGRLLRQGLKLHTNMLLTRLVPDGAELTCRFTGQTHVIPCSGFVPVTSREPRDDLWMSLQNSHLATLKRIGDCQAPGLIAQAVYAGHKVAQEWGGGTADAKRERVVADQ